MARKKKKTNPMTVAIPIILALLVVAAIVVASYGINKNNTEEDTDIAANNTPETSPDKKDPPPSDTDDVTTDKPKDEPQPPVEVVKYYNPLTGLECSEELSKQRPIAVMINNIRYAMPQEGVSNADVLYECLAEGGITRLMMLKTDYTTLEQIGSIRSSRDYYLDFAQNHDAIYFHAGGSPKAYSDIASRKINNCDAGTLEGSTPQTFFRDPWRRQNFAWEHTLVINGSGIANAIQMKGYRTELNETFNSPLKFAKEKVTLEGNSASCVYIPFSYEHTPYMQYDEQTGTYKRWQFGKMHADKDGTQLEFDNIIILFCHHTGALDASGRIAVTTTGTGEGYYITGGKYINIKYSKATVDTPVELYNTDGTPLEINTGKTYIAVFNQANKNSINMNYEN